MSDLLSAVSNLTTRRLQLGENSWFTVFPVVAGTAPLAAEHALKTGSGRTLDLIPTPLLRPRAALQVAHSMLHAHIPGWITDRTIRLTILKSGGHPRSLAFSLLSLVEVGSITWKMGSPMMPDELIAMLLLESYPDDLEDKLVHEGYLGQAGAPTPEKQKGPFLRECTSYFVLFLSNVDYIVLLAAGAGVAPVIEKFGGLNVIDALPPTPVVAAPIGRTYLLYWDVHSLTL